MSSSESTINAVIYARYSSHSQTEQSIEGQLHDAYEFAEREHYRIVGEYIDRAITGKSDDRPDFQRMIEDSKKKAFKVVIVWKLDRFSRNRYDSAIYKRILKKNGVRVVSVMENITDSPEGIILEGLLEAMAEYYSANLAENIRRGQQESVKKGWFCGGAVPLGYIVQDHRLVPDPKTAEIIREIYSRYAAGERLADIAKDLNARGYRTKKGRPFAVSSFDSIIPNPAYIGEYAYAGQTIPGLADPLVSREIYEKACAVRSARRRAPAANRSQAVDFVLQGKLFCGECGSPMCGDCGTAKNGIRHYYYSCSDRKHKKAKCPKKSEKKDFLEWYICEQTVDYILDPERMAMIAQRVVAIYNQDTDQARISALEQSIRQIKDDVSALIDKLITVPKEAAAPIGEKIKTLELQRVDQETELSKLRIQKKITISEAEVIAWLRTFRNGDLFDEKFRHQLMDVFLNSVYVYNDKIVIFYNVKSGQETIYTKKAGPSHSTLSDISGALPPKVEPCYIFLHDMIGLVCFRGLE